MNNLHGAFVVHKPEGLTSSECVTRIKHALINHGYTNKKIRIGHGGTLDPFATGVLVVLFGEATKLADTYLHSRKAYSGVIQLGTQTTTADLTGEVVTEAPVPSLTLNEWQRLADSFVQDEYLQTPPMYSAKKKDGVALHEMARSGKVVERSAILKKIFEFKLSQGETTSQLCFEVACESGTYVRTLAEDLALKAGTRAHLKTLCRTQSSDCMLADAMPLSDLLSALQNKIAVQDLSCYRPLSKVSTHLQKISVDASQASALRQGRTDEILRLCERADQEYDKQRYLRAETATELVALLSKQESELFRLQCVFNPIR